MARSRRYILVFGLILLSAGCTRSTSIEQASNEYPTSFTLPVSSQNSAGAGVVAGEKGACGSSLSLSGSQYRGLYPINVVCTTGMVADLARAVGGDHVKVGQLMGAGVDPHQYKASPGDVSALGNADIIFFSGLRLERKMTDVFNCMAAQKPTYAVTQLIPGQSLLSSGEDVDPHVWLDVSLWRHALDVVREGLAKFDPIHADDYQSRAAEYGEQLDALHESIKSRLAEVPTDRRVLITAHDAFRYFGRVYNVEVHGTQGISTDDEAGVREIERLVDFLVQRKIKTVFAETSVSDRNIQAVVEGCRAKGHEVTIGQELFSDALGKPNATESTPSGYIGMIRHNVDGIVEGMK